MYANDTLTTLTDANALAKFGGKYRKEIESVNTPEVLKSLTMDGELYGVLFTTNTWYMYYDKSVFSEEDVKNLEAMLEKGTVANPNAKNMEAAVKLAVYLGGEEAQRAHYEFRNVVPCHTKLLEDKTIAENSVIVAQAGFCFRKSNLLCKFRSVYHCNWAVEDVGKRIY